MNGKRALTNRRHGGCSRVVGVASFALFRVAEKNARRADRAKADSTRVAVTTTALWKTGVKDDLERKTDKIDSNSIARGRSRAAHLHSARKR
jgi:hypothetical protein